MEFLASPPVPDDLKAAAARKVRRLGPELAQAVIDEWVYRFYAGLIERSALGYLDQPFQGGNLLILLWAHSCPRRRYLAKSFRSPMCS